mgnify:CR=1 FL=1
MSWKSVLAYIVLGAFWLVTGAMPFGGHDDGMAVDGPRLGVVTAWKGPIGPASTAYLENAITHVEKKNAHVLIFQLDTPGGLATSMRDMISAILESSVPIVGYVAPPGAHAASAGTYIIYATHLAAMAPGTNIGAATPVQLGGGFPGSPSRKDETPKEKSGKSDPSQSGEKNDESTREQTGTNEPHAAKAVNDAIAFIRSLAELRNRNADWAESAVRNAASMSANEALEKQVVEVVASDISALLKAIDGRAVMMGDRQVRLETSTLSLERLEPTPLIRLLAFLTDPNVALILMLIGIYGLIFEFANPGTLGPGIIGAICLVLGLYALNQLPIDYAGLALILLGLAFMVAEAFTPTFGVLGLGGAIAFVVGAILLIDTDVPAFQLSWSVIAGTALASFATLTLLLTYVWRSQRRPVVSGREELKGARAEVIDWSGDSGHVWLHGELWQARGDNALNPGDIVVVDHLDGLTLVLHRRGP